MNLGHKFKIKLLFTDIEEVYVSDLSSLLYNLESACDLAMILYLEDYKEYRVPTDYYGRFRKIKKNINYVYLK